MDGEIELTPKEVAARLGVSEWTVRRLLQSRELAGIDKSSGSQYGRWFIYESSLVAFVKRRQIEAFPDGQ